MSKHTLDWSVNKQPFYTFQGKYFILGSWTNCANLFWANYKNASQNGEHVRVVVHSHDLLNNKNFCPSLINMDWLFLLIPLVQKII